MNEVSNSKLVILSFNESIGLKKIVAAICEKPK